MEFVDTEPRFASEVTKLRLHGTSTLSYRNIFSFYDVIHEVRFHFLIKLNYLTSCFFILQYSVIAFYTCAFFIFGYSRKYTVLQNRTKWRIDQSKGSILHISQSNAWTAKFKARFGQWRMDQSNCSIWYTSQSHTSAAKSKKEWNISHWIEVVWANQNAAFGLLSNQILQQLRSTCFL